MAAPSPPPVPAPAPLALHRRPEVRAWVLYDWANSAFMTTVVTAVFPVYFAAVAAADLEATRATRLYGWATSLSLLCVALLAPPLGWRADRLARRKAYLLRFTLLGVGATLGLWFVGRGDWVLGLVLFGLANLGAGAGAAFYDSLLPHVARRDEVDRVSTAGFAIGYVGGGVLLAVQSLWLTHPEWFGEEHATLGPRLAFLTAGLWWLAFSGPIFRRVPEPPPVSDVTASGEPVAARAGRPGLLGTLRELRAYPQVALLLLAFFIYNDGVLTIIRMATIYGRQVGIGTSDMVLAVLLVQFIGVPCTFLFGRFAGTVGAKRGVLLGLAVYACVALLGYWMSATWHFYLLAVLVGLVQGGVQALSRSLFAAMVPRQRSAEFFGVFAVGEKFAGILGPLLFAEAAALSEGGRGAMFVVLAMFALGAVLLVRVDVDRGVARAGAAEEELAAR